MKTLEKQSLFWDVDIEKIDPDAHKFFIARRIFEKGDLDDLRWAVDFYGRKSLRDIFLKEADKIDVKSGNFWCLYFNIDKKECTRKQSTKKHIAFWRR